MIELYNADCYEKIKEIPDDSVDLVIIDPPYDIHAGFGGGIMKGPTKEYLNQIKSMSEGFRGEILRESKELGRSFIGIEIDEKYFEIANNRIENAGQTLF